MPAALKVTTALLEPGSHQRRDFTDALPCWVSLHVQKHGASDEQEAVNCCRGFGNVCRVRA